MPNEKENPYEPASSDRFSLTDAVDNWTESNKSAVRTQLRMIQLISIFLIAGVSGYGIFVLSQKWAPPVALPIPILIALLSMSSTALVLGLGAALSEIGYSSMRASVAKESDEQSKLLTACKLLNSRTIISLALREGAGMFSLFEFSTTRSMIALVLAGILILSMVLTIPTWGSYTRKILRTL